MGYLIKTNSYRFFAFVLALILTQNVSAKQIEERSLHFEIIEKVGALLFRSEEIQYMVLIGKIENPKFHSRNKLIGIHVQDSEFIEKLNAGDKLDLCIKRNWKKYGWNIYNDKKINIYTPDYIIDNDGQHIFQERIIE